MEKKYLDSVNDDDDIGYKMLVCFHHVFKQRHIRLIDMDGKPNSICCVDERASPIWWVCEPTCCHNLASKHAAPNKSGFFVKADF